MSTSVVDEGGFYQNINDNEYALKLIVQAISEAGYKDHKLCNRNFY